MSGYAKKPLPADSALARYLERPPVGVRFPTKREISADIIVQIISEDARVEDSKIANAAYLAVKIAEMRYYGANATRNPSDHTPHFTLGAEGRM